MKTETNEAQDIARTLGVDRSSGRSGRLRRWLVAGLVLAALAAAAVFWWMAAETAKEPRYKTQEAERGNLVVTVTATGTLEPVNQVDVGSEISGTIKTVEVDYNDKVKAGQVLARMDTDRLRAELQQSEALQESAQANLLEAQATAVEARNQLARLRSVWETSSGKVPSQQDLDAADAALKRAEAADASARAKVIESQATLDVNRTNLSKAVIRSPIDGVVLNRNVEPGQTVAASLQAPVLFTLAENLANMELHVDVDEADVGQVKEGQEASFTVDAFPGRSFRARITQVRFGSKTLEGVVTYETVLLVDNSDLSLRPGMTATADIIVKKVQDAVLVPNAALRFSPPVQAKEAPSNGGSMISRIFPRPRPAQPERNRKTTADERQQRVWTLKQGQPVAVAITTGSSDGRMTEVQSGEIRPGMALVVDVEEIAK